MSFDVSVRYFAQLSSQISCGAEVMEVQQWNGATMMQSDPDEVRLLACLGYVMLYIFRLCPPWMQSKKTERQRKYDIAVSL